MKMLLLGAAGLVASALPASAQTASPAPGTVTPMPPEGLSVGPASKGGSSEPADGGLQAAAAFLQAFQGTGTNSPLAKLGAQPVVDFRELKGLLPGQISGCRRTGANGEKSGFMGAEISMAQGDYGAPDGPRFRVKITDLGGMGPLGSLAGLAWAAAEVDREGDRGYERTASFQGHKGHEQYDAATRRGTTSVTVAGRFLLEIEGVDVEAGQMRSAIDAFDLPALAKLGPPPASGP